MIILKKLTIKNKEEYNEMIIQWKKVEEHHSVLMNEDNLPFNLFVKQINILESNKLNPTKYYLVYDNSMLIGYLELRFGQNDFNSNYAGHIGYAVSPRFRNQGYGMQILKKGLSILKKEKVTPIILTCDLNHALSKKMFMKCGAKFFKRSFYLNEEKEIYRL